MLSVTSQNINVTGNGSNVSPLFVTIARDFRASSKNVVNLFHVSNARMQESISNVPVRDATYKKHD